MLIFQAQTAKIPLLMVKKFILSLILIMFCCGCSSEQGQLFDKSEMPIVWPEPPQEARIKYIGQLSTEDDLKKGVSSIDAFGRFIFGRKDIGVMSSPRGLVLNDDEKLFVADASGSVVHMLDLRARKYKQFSTLAGEEKLLSPIDLAIVDENIYVSDSVLQQICVFGREGGYKFSFGSDILQRPSGIGYNNVNGKLYVSDTKRHVVDVFDKEGNHLSVIGKRGIGNGAFNFPTYLWVDREGKVYVSDTLNYRVQVFDADGKFFMTLGKHGNRPGYFAHPCGIATDSFGNIYVADKQFENIQIFNKQGQLLIAVGGEGHGPGQFWLPAGLFIDQNDRIFVADSFNKRVQVLQLLEVEKP